MPSGSDTQSSSRTREGESLDKSDDAPAAKKFVPNNPATSSSSSSTGPAVHDIPLPPPSMPPPPPVAGPSTLPGGHMRPPLRQPGPGPS